MISSKKEFFMSLIIGVGGLLEHGKDAFADRLVDEHGFVKLGMSDVLAEALYVLNPWVNWPATEEFLEFSNWSSSQLTRYQHVVDEFGYVQAKKIPEVRRLLQVLGTEVGRRLISENIWTDIAYGRLVERSNAGWDVVITGVRYKNELEIFDQLLEEGFIATSVWVDRPGHVSAGTSSTAAHSSENSVSGEDFEYVLSNNSDLKGLHERSDALLSTIRRDFDA